MTRVFKGLLFCATFLLATGLYGANEADLPCNAEMELQPFPAQAKDAVSTLLDFAAATNAPFVPASTEQLVKFVSEASQKDSGWELPKRAGAAGSAYIVKVKVPLQQYLNINFHPAIPDYAVFPACLRFSASVNKGDMQQAYACITAGPTGQQAYASGHMTGMEEITPNPESGGYFSYTNARTFLRCRVSGHDVLFSCSDTLAPSTTSNRGALISPLEKALFYYSGKQGLNITGMKWMLSQIFRSTTLSVYVELNPNETAVATFAWLNAGWNGMNVTRACHILNSQRHTLDFSRRIAEHPGVNAPVLAALASNVTGMTEAAVNTEYARYLSYVQTWRDQQSKGFFGGSVLAELYDPDESLNLPMSYRRALVIQERVRTLLGIPTWSSTAGHADTPGN